MMPRRAPGTASLRVHSRWPLMRPWCGFVLELASCVVHRFVRFRALEDSNLYHVPVAYGARTGEDGPERKYAVQGISYGLFVWALTFFIGI